MVPQQRRKRNRACRRCIRRGCEKNKTHGDSEATGALTSVMTISREVFARYAVKATIHSPNQTKRTRLFNHSPLTGQSLRAASRPTGFFLIPSKVFPSSDTRTTLHGRCCAHGNLLSLVLHFHSFALILRRRDCTWKVLQTLSRLRPFTSLSLSHRTLPPLMLTLKRHFLPLLLRPSPLTSLSPRLGVPPLALVSQRTPLR